MPDATDLQTLCDAVLAASVAALDTIPGFAPGLEGAPARTFVGAGQPVPDCCPQLSVNANTIREAPTEPLGLGSGTRHRLGMRLSLVGIQVWIFRCSANGEAGQPPTEAALAALLDSSWARVADEELDRLQRLITAARKQGR